MLSRVVLIINILYQLCELNQLTNQSVDQNAHMVLCAANESKEKR